IDETDEPIDNPPLSPEEEAAFGAAMRGWMAIPPGERRPLINALAEQIDSSVSVDASYRILSNVRSNRFNEMEYAVPREVGAACVREVLDTIARNEIDVVFPLEYRYVRGDDLWLSMDEGGDRAAISVHRTASADYRPLFDAVEPIFWKYGGRPHWGKVHSLGHAELTKLYPRFEDFRRLRAELDPEGRLLNEHLRKLFGV
ncbi:MAG TPA: D-arabinono-1,4-lactone oxidase, partial [Pseudomonadales bacterium]